MIFTEVVCLKATDYVHCASSLVVKRPRHHEGRLPLASAQHKGFTHLLTIADLAFRLTYHILILRLIGVVNILPFRLSTTWPCEQTPDGKPMIPIIPLRREWKVGSATYSRELFPVFLGFAITDHKSQGMEARNIAESVQPST